MVDKNKNYWLYIASYVYCSIKNQCALLYNTLTGTYLETDNCEIIDLLQSLHEKKNLGAICCEGKKLVETPYCEFITEFCTKEMGDLIDVAQLPIKPIQLMPILNLQYDIDKLQKGEILKIGEEILQNLLEINIYINNNCEQNCRYCSDYCRQIYCCKSSKEQNFLEIPVLQDILSQIKYGVVNKINIMGGNIFSYPELIKLNSVFACFREFTHFYIHYKNFKKNDISDSFFIELIVNFPIDNEVLNKVLSYINTEKTTVHFIIENEEQYTITEQLCENFLLEKYQIIPFFNGRNSKFFKENVFMNKEDIFINPLQMREIFRNQKINSNFFGGLYILPDGTVKANLNADVLGNIKKDKILELVHKEMVDNTAWRQVRNSKPCNSCNYQFICPPPSNYETVIGKSNLCQIT
ncbi:MAG: TIGR04150 pseudo-rSAM protein [Candidatus Azobacteroides sp.]|nr:TIGR04150 pseudo-rSAM protein [Candidatus Azobacteroides sp.]